MRSGRVTAGLATANAVLLACVVVAAVMSRTPAGAQPTGQPGIQGPGDGAAGSRPRGQYTMLSGRTQTGSNHAIFVIDAVNQEMVALRWDPSRKVMTGIGYRSLGNDAQGGGGR